VPVPVPETYQNAASAGIYNKYEAEAARSRG
jgi:hypothetical protein